MAGDRLIQTIHKMSQMPSGDTTDLLFGEVTSISPLKIFIDNRFEVDEQFLILSNLVKETYIDIPFMEASTHFHDIPLHETDPGGADDHIHQIQPIITEPALKSIRLWRGLQIGDKVRILRVTNGKMFYIIEREGSL